MLTIKEILNSYKGKELFIRAFDSGIAIKANPSNFSDYQIITKIGDELFEVEEYIRGQTAPKAIYYYSIAHIGRIQKL